ncbi:cytochrome P450 [Streptomyces hainanensis]|uniref:Cytochrome P450 n=1 Tax=Streptomyces hainanensis TaxID=402648 RepID=A0A4R4TJZ1_9ACTN|nr:cytochrome P450 [Streptomyces hainanensis]TDC74469.1 cytochrome P450 [Streptomyces hainanensis]
MTPTIPRSDIDLWSEEVIQAPYAAYRELRDLGPAVWLERYQVYAVTRYDDVYEALHDHDAFASGAGVALNERLNQKMKGSALVSDPPYHDHVRGVMGGPLTPKALRAHREDFQRLADDLIDRLLERGDFDAVVDFAQLFPLSVVPDLLGWPTEGRENFLAWASAGFNALGPMNERAEADIPVLAGMWAFMAEIVQPGRLRAGSWGDDLVAAAQAGTVSKQLLPALIGDYLVPSLDTTVSSLTSAMLLLGRHPEQWRAVREDPALIPNALNEVIRLETPIRALARTVTRDRELSGTVLPAGSRALIVYASANRDERHWDEPETFDVTRANANTHVGFGHGIHGCVGQGLARLEGHALLTALAEKVETIDVGQPEYRVHNTIRAITTLPATLKAST